MEAIKNLCTPNQIRLKSTQIFLIAGSLLLTLLITILCVGFLVRYEVEHEVANVNDIEYWKDTKTIEQQIWYDEGIQELNTAFHKVQQHGMQVRPRNVIIFQANGVDVQLLAAARFQRNKSQPMEMSWDRFAHLAHLKNSCSSTDRCDAATKATILYGGVRANLKLAGLDEFVKFRNCSAALNVTHQVRSIVRQAQLTGLRTGFATNQRITGATGAALFAHVPDTSWECDATMPKGAIKAGCTDVARQLISGETGRQLNVIMGGGRQTLNEDVPTPSWDVISADVCRSADKRNLLRDWQTLKLLSKSKFELLQQSEQLGKFNDSTTDYLLGVFANGDLTNNKRAPKLAALAQKALIVLNSSQKGFLFVIEQQFKQQQSRAQHLAQLLEFDELIEQTLKAQEGTTKDTLHLVIFTRGNYLAHDLDTSEETDMLTNVHDILTDDRLLKKQLVDLAADTLVFANGPQAWLLQGVHSEIYLAHVIGYALKLGESRVATKL